LGQHLLSNTKGQIIKKGRINAQKIGLNKITIKIDKSLPPQTLLLTVIIDNKFYITKKIRKE
jgi:hypothetical protein